jgi:hypothetical protein
MSAPAVAVAQWPHGLISNSRVADSFTLPAMHHDMLTHKESPLTGLLTAPLRCFQTVTI